MCGIASVDAVASMLPLLPLLPLPLPLQSILSMPSQQRAGMEWKWLPKYAMTEKTAPQPWEQLWSSPVGVS